MPDDLATLAVRALDGRVPGAAVAVRQGTQTVLSACYGHADLEWQIPVTPDTVFRLASLSKPMTALTVVLLARDGVLDLDAPLRAYLPEYPAHAAAVTVRHLLTHTSGIPNFVTAPDFASTISRLDHTDAELRARFADLPLHWTPGERYGYSNSGYRLLDMIVSEVTGRPFAQVLAEKVFAPAGMRDSRLLDDATIVPRRAAGYRPGPDGDSFSNADLLSMTVPGGAGGIGSTLDDLVRFDRALFVDGTFAGVEELIAPVRLTSGRSEGYGMGFASQAYRGRRLVHHAGGINGFSCLYLCLPDDGISAILLTNLDGFPCSRALQPLVDMLLGADPAGPPAPAGPPDETHAGTYRDSLTTVEVTVVGDRLAVSCAGRTHQLVRLSATDYADAEVTLRFHDDGPAPGCTLSVPFTWVTGYRDPD